MVKWEYKTIAPGLELSATVEYLDWKSQVEPQLEALGKDGWELIGIMGLIFIFKRPVNG